MLSMIFANLIEKHRLSRRFNVITPEGVFELVYNGEGMGYEEIIIDNKIASRIKSYVWYVPKFEFFIGSLPAKVEVSVSGWLKISCFSIIINNETVYTE